MPVAQRAATQHVQQHGHVTVHTYEDTPAKRTYRQLEENWRGGIFKGQQAPDFALMRELVQQHDDTQFTDPKRVFPMPEKGPTGKGYMQDDRETSHFVRETLHRISPILSAAYGGEGGIHEDFERHHTNTDFQYGQNGYSKSSDSKAYQHRLYNHQPSGDQSGERPRLIMVGRGYDRQLY